MTANPLFSLFGSSIAPLHPTGTGLDELLPAGLAVLIAIGVYTVIAGGRSDQTKRGGERARRRRGE